MLPWAHLISFSLALLSCTTLIWSEATFSFSTWLFFKLLGACYVVAFASLWVQIYGLIGSNGLIPLSDTMTAMDEFWRKRLATKEERKREHPAKSTRFSLPLLQWTHDKFSSLRNSKYLSIPTLFWLSSTDRAIHRVLLVGTIAATLLIVGIGPAPLLILLMYSCYLSFMHVTEDFLSLQWDVLLLESGFFSFFLALSSPGLLQWLHLFPSQVSEPSRLALFQLWWLLFRLMASSGVVKLSSKDPSWASLTAMNYHYSTQPLPNPMSHFMHNLPPSIHKIETVGTFVIELLMPFFIFGNHWTRLLGSLLYAIAILSSPIALLSAFLSFTALNATISLTGNYGFFNYLYSLISVLLLDNAHWSMLFSLLPYPLSSFALSLVTSTSPGLHLYWSDILHLPLLLFTVVFSILPMNRALRMMVIPFPKSLHRIYKYLAPFYLINCYGLFAVMTTTRVELVIEGSDDGQHWIPYEFKYKPGNIRRRPPFIPGHMPRLDWRMWFCAFHRWPNIPSWFAKFLQDIASGNETVLSLLDTVPVFGGEKNRPPRYLRVMRYLYELSDRKTLQENGMWWQRTLKGPFLPFPLATGSEEELKPEPAE